MNKVPPPHPARVLAFPLPQGERERNLHLLHFLFAYSRKHHSLTNSSLVPLALKHFDRGAGHKDVVILGPMEFKVAAG